ncbi:IclR family transcriptional regulator [Rhizobium sp. 9140]|uniref:IclR family transcriptional regulator n=1 Tax=Rhizobium sp. 9140 TaxID=1761900 RepID=UPI0007983D54|nr:IclR family transcriptional regulator [Rhizobium sp. 9140]CZT37993.1 transcriptional regulator, IclR family [Rhizobium sp. 9140]
MTDDNSKGGAAVKTAVPAVERATRLLDMVALSDEPQTLSGLSRHLGLPKSSIHGLCNTLVELGLLDRNGSGFVMGGHVMLWANAFVAKSDMVSEFVRLWEGQSALKTETATLTILDGSDVVYIASQHGLDPLGITFRTGMRLPAAFTATGKAILSTMPQSAIVQLYPNGLPAPLTTHTVATLDALFQELEQIRTAGYSIDDQQVREGMFCFGAPVYDFSGNRAVGGIAFSIHANQLNEARSREIGQNVIQHARLLSQRLGSQPIRK